MAPRLEFLKILSRDTILRHHFNNLGTKKMVRKVFIFWVEWVAKGRAQSKKNLEFSRFQSRVNTDFEVNIKNLPSLKLSDKTVWNE